MPDRSIAGSATMCVGVERSPPGPIAIARLVRRRRDAGGARSPRAVQEIREASLAD